MAEIEFLFYIELPVRVIAEHQPKEPASRHYPGCPEAMGIEDIEICLPNPNDEAEDTPAKSLDEIKDMILLLHDDQMVMQAWEHK